MRTKLAVIIAIVAAFAVWFGIETFIYENFRRFHYRAGQFVIIIELAAAFSVGLITYFAVAHGNLAKSNKDISFVVGLLVYMVIVSAALYLFWELCTYLDIQLVGNLVTALGGFGAIFGFFYLKERFNW